MSAPTEIFFKQKDWHKGDFTWKYYKITDTLGDKSKVVMLSWEADGSYFREVDTPFEILTEYLKELEGRGEIVYKNQ